MGEEGGEGRLSGMRVVEGVKGQIVLEGIPPSPNLLYLPRPKIYFPFNPESNSW